MSDYKYKFSIIMAVYNVEPFLREAVDSIIDQTIGIKNIQLILVDDGSPDNCPAICDEYAEKYPNNIFVIHKENGGVSSARNLGLKSVEGEYVNFVDSDDMLTPETLENVYKLFKESGEQIDVVSIPIWFFEGSNTGHILNYKFHQGTRIIDLNEEWTNIQLSCSAAFIRAEALKGLEFDTRLAYGEDANLMQRVLMKKQTLGVASRARYMYRKRVTGVPSALQNSYNREKWYLPSLKYFLKSTIDYAKENFGYVPKFVQFAVMYDIQWRVKQRDFLENETISAEDKEEYLNILKEILKDIDDEVIMRQKNLTQQQRIFTLELKYSSNPLIAESEEEDEDGELYMSYSEVGSFKISTLPVHIEFLKVYKDYANLEGYFEIYNMPFDEFNLACWVNDKKIEINTYDLPGKTTCLTKITNKKLGFNFNIDLTEDKIHKIRFGATINGKQVIFQRFSYRYFSPVSRDFRFSHYVKNGWLVTNRKDCLKIKKSTFVKKALQKGLFYLWMLKNNKNGSRKVMRLRLLNSLAKPFVKKPIWLVSDRANVAGDNGEAFFRYLRAEHPEINAKFVINKGSKDYKRLKEIGPVVNFKKASHKINLLLSECVFSSQGENEHFDPFGGSARNAVRDILVDKPFVFLQHGVIMNDLSEWLFRRNKNIFGFITSAKNEYDSIVDGNYDYPPERVWLTGLPRFDRLYDDSQKVISIMPTWRKGLTAGNNPITREWALKDDFTESEYFNFYNSLINHPRLLETATRTGYKINFALHPNLRAGAEFFNENEYASVNAEALDYNRVYAISDLIVTDYSSSIFDFVYLRKPVIYAQFDYDSFFDGSHSVGKGYFEFERDGFGEVEYNLDATVDRIIEYMENGCELKPKYRERIDGFFAYSDKNNSKRIYERVIEQREQGNL